MRERGALLPRLQTRGGGGCRRRCPGTLRQRSSTSSVLAPWRVPATGEGGRGTFFGSCCSRGPGGDNQLAGARANRASQKGGYSHQLVKYTTFGGRAPLISRAVPAGRLWARSMGSLGWSLDEYVTLADGRGDHKADVFTERTAKSA